MNTPNPFINFFGSLLVNLVNRGLTIRGVAMATNRERLNTLYKKFGLEKEDTFKHQHYTILTRSGIEKVQRGANIKVQYEVIKCEPDFSCVKAFATMNDSSIETFGSCKRGKGGDGNTISWYVMEIAEKRAMSRAVLKLAGLYEMGHMGEDESEDFKAPTLSQQTAIEVDRLIKELKSKNCSLARAEQIMTDMQDREAENPNSPWVAVINVAMNEFGDNFYTRGDELLNENQLTDLEENYTSKPDDDF